MYISIGSICQCHCICVCIQERKTHFALVCEKNDEMAIMDAWDNNKPIPDDITWQGIITLEDIMEDLIQEEITDEFDMRKFDNLSQASIVIKKEKWTDDESFAESVSRDLVQRIRGQREL